MSTFASPIALTIFDTSPDGSAVFPFSILLTDSLTISLSTRIGTPQLYLPA